MKPKALTPLTAQITPHCDGGTTA